MFLSCHRRTRDTYPDVLDVLTHYPCQAYYFRCIAIVLPLKRMEWMTVQAARTRIIPLVVICALAYTSYKSLVTTKADPGILACNAVSGTSVAVSKWSLFFII